LNFTKFIAIQTGETQIYMIVSSKGSVKTSRHLVILRRLVSVNH